MDQKISTEQNIQNKNYNYYYDKTVQQEAVESIVDEHVCHGNNDNNCFQNNCNDKENVEKITTSLENDNEENKDDSEVILEVCEIIKQISDVDDYKVIDLVQLITTDAQLLYYTGINLDILKNLSEVAYLIEMSERGVDKCISFETIRDRIVLCLCKLRRNYPFRVLSMLFGMTPKDCEYNFYYMTALLSEILRKLIYWPGRDEIREQIKRSIPQRFLNFTDVQVVLHCIEIAVNKPPNCLKCSFCTHCLSKGCTTVKFLVALTPSGLITYVSKTFGGLVPVQAVIEKSNILQNVNLKRNAIMVNSSLGASLKELEKQVKIVKPYIHDSQEKYTDEQKKFNAKFEACYSQINAIVGKFKEFRILSSTLSVGMACCIDEIATIIAGLINLQE